MKKTIFEYGNYREFLADFYAHKKAQNKKFSYRYFSRLCDIGSPSFFKHVIDGERNLTLPVIEKFIKGLKLNSHEASFFRSLVLLNQATTSKEREFHSEELLKNKFLSKFQPLTAAQLRYYEHWYYIAIRELVATKGFKDDPEWIARQLSPTITPADAKRAITELINLGLLSYDERHQLVQSNPTISTGNEVSSSFVSKFHREMMKKASEAIDAYPKPQRDISSATFGVSSQTYQAIKEKIQKFRKEILELAANDDCPEFVCQLNLQSFPLSKAEGDE